MKTREELVAEENKNSSEFYPAGNPDSNLISEEMGLTEEEYTFAHDKWLAETDVFEAKKDASIACIGIELEKTLTKKELAFVVTAVTIKLYKMKQVSEKRLLIEALVAEFTESRKG